jgi:hypothetical protein
MKRKYRSKSGLNLSFNLEEFMHDKLKDKDSN